MATITINGGSTSKYFKGWDSFKNPTTYSIPYITANSQFTGSTIIKDVTSLSYSAANSVVNNKVYCNLPITGFTNETPSICDATNFPNVTTLQNGVGKINLTTPNGNLQCKFDCSLSITFSEKYVSEYGTGSLAKKINDLVLSAVGNNTTPSASFMNLYSGGSNLNPNLYTKNIIDLSPFAELVGSVCLVTPRHITSCDHSHPVVGNTVTFRDNNGVAQTKTITAISSTSAGASDIWIGYLDSAVTGITPYSILPPNATTATKIPLASENTGAYGSLPMGIYGFVAKQRNVFGGQDYTRQMQLGRVGNICGSLTSQTCNSGGAGVLSQNGSSTTNGYPWISSSNDLRYPYQYWYTSLTGGDSGSPAFLPTGLSTSTGTPLTILLGHASTSGSFSSLSYYASQVNTAMNVMKDVGDTTVYALDDISVSQSAWWNSFTTY